MVKHQVYSLAMRVLSTNGSFLSNVTRIRNGFMAEKNIEEARRYVSEMTTILDQMEQTLKTNNKIPDDYMPLK